MTVERSALSVPASNRRMIEKAPALGADVTFFDLEDAVAPSEKAASRENVVWALTELDWSATRVGYRINGLDTPFCYRDLIEVVEPAGDRLDLIVVPKVRSPGDVATVDNLLHQIELARGYESGKIRLQIIVESAPGLSSVEAIAGSSPRIETLIFGPGDFAADMRIPASGVGTEDEWDELYPGHRFHYAMSRIAVAGRAQGLILVDGPVANFRDPESFRRSCLIARSLGYDGKWCIHPSQIPVANELFMPSADEIRRAEEIMAAYEEATRSGVGAIALDGTMVDVASIKLAEATLAVARRAAG